MKEYNPDEMWYVTDGRQALHFEQVFRAARKSGLIDNSIKLEHIPFGTMNGKDGKPFKTRDGGVMSLKSLMDLVYQETFKNKLVSPDLLGVSTGASVGAALAIVLGLSSFFISVFAFIAGVVTVLITVIISMKYFKSGEFAAGLKL